MTEGLRAAWLAHLGTVRWFGGKGAGARLDHLEPLASWTPPGASPAVHSEIATLAYPDGHTEHYHLLVAHHPEGSRPEAVVLGTTEADGRRVLVTDATTDAAALAAFVAATAPDFADVAVSVWPGEQSNTTLCLGDTDLYKLFRRIEPGPNLDAEVLVALHDGPVPAVRGRLQADWPAGTRTDLGLILERVPGAVDGWVIATRACAAGQDFTTRAHELGVALRAVHGHLADAFGTDTVAGDDVADTMLRRLEVAVAQAPVLRPYAGALRGRFDTLRGRTLAVQRVHGDFHLGQTLASPGGWTIIDFEGEPAKTAAERRAADSVWRDVAGMLRSFDYARSAHASPASDAAQAWARSAADAFLDGYAAGSDDGLLAAYVLDKAVYEVVYEVRNRPDWVAIPLGAVADTARASAPTREP